MQSDAQSPNEVQKDQLTDRVASHVLPLPGKSAGRLLLMPDRTGDQDQPRLILFGRCLPQDVSVFDSSLGGVCANPEFSTINGKFYN